MHIPDLNALSLPLFAVVLILEVLLNMKENLGLYNFKDSIVNFMLGGVLIIIGLLVKLLAILFFTWVHQYKLFEIDNSLLSWIVAIFLCDLIFYCFHYLGHVCRIFWANHVVHHSSDYYNYSVGMRNHFIHVLYRFIFWSPMCFLGFDPYMILFIDNVTNLLQFLLHTQLVGKLGPLEYIFNTPSHHRVHHGSNEKYLDKNFGGIFIIYDRLFGTFAEENEKVVYGITSKVETSNLFQIAFHEYAKIIQDLRYCPGIRSKIKLLFSNPSSLKTERQPEQKHSIANSAQVKLL